MRASEKRSSTIFIEAETNNRMAPLQMLHIVILTHIFKETKLAIFDKYRLVKCNHYYCHQIGSEVFALQMLYIMTLTYILQVTKLEI